MSAGSTHNVSSLMPYGSRSSTCIPCEAPYQGCTRLSKSPATTVPGCERRLAPIPGPRMPLFCRRIGVPTTPVASTVHFAMMRAVPVFVPVNGSEMCPSIPETRPPVTMRRSATIEVYTRPPSASSSGTPRRSCESFAPFVQPYMQPPEPRHPSSLRAIGTDFRPIAAAPFANRSLRGPCIAGATGFTLMKASTAS